MILTFNIYSQDIKKYVCNGWGIDVFEEADINSKVIGHVSFGESVEIIENTDIEVQDEGKGFWWKEISCNGVNGYVSSKWLVSSFETAVKIRRIEGTWIRDKKKSNLIPPDNEYISFVFSGKGEESLFIVNGEENFYIEKERVFWLCVDKIGQGFPDRDEEYFFINHRLKCSAVCHKYEWKYDEYGNPIDYPKELKRWQTDYFYKKINFHENFDSVYSVNSDCTNYRTISSESIALWTTPSFSSRTTAIMGPGTAIEVLDVKKDSGEVVPGWVKVSVLKPLEAGGYEKTNIVGWCYWGQ